MVLNSVNVLTRCIRYLSLLRGFTPWRKTDLPDDRAFEHNQHEKSEETVIPVFIQAPQSNAKHLKYKEWCRCVFTEKFRKRRYGDIEFVASV